MHSNGCESQVHGILILENIRSCMQNDCTLPRFDWPATTGCAERHLLFVSGPCCHFLCLLACHTELLIVEYPARYDLLFLILIYCRQYFIRNPITFTSDVKGAWAYAAGVFSGSPRDRASCDSEIGPPTPTRLGN